MSVKYLSFISISLAVGATNLPASVTFFWSESGSDVRLAVEGSFDVTGWSVINSNHLGNGVVFRNVDYGPMFGGPEPFGEDLAQELQMNQTSTGGQLTLSPAGEFVLFPWNTPTGVDTNGTFESGTFAGQVSLLGSGVSAALQTSSVVESAFAVDAVYRFNNTTLVGLFGDGLAAWSGGAHIGNIGGNEVWFTVIPEPSSYGLLVGVAGLCLVQSRRRVSKMRKKVQTDGPA
jgi:hypothetical protein